MVAAHLQVLLNLVGVVVSELRQVHRQADGGAVGRVVELRHAELGDLDRRDLERRRIIRVGHGAQVRPGTRNSLVIVGLRMLLNHTLSEWFGRAVNGESRRCDLHRAGVVGGRVAQQVAAGQRLALT